MAVELPRLDKQAKVPMVEQVAAHYRGEIESGRLRAGDRLPPIRTVADHVGVTRATVQESYRRLAEAGLVSATVGRGTTVLERGESQPQSAFSPGADAVWRHLRQMQPAPVAGERLLANFGSLFPDPALFPVEAFRVAMERMLLQHGSELLVYGGQAMGDDRLRALLAERSQPPGEIMITSGAQQGIDLVLRTFTSPGDAVAVPIPTYHHLFGLLKAHQVELVPVSTSVRGIDLAELERALARPRVRLLYVMPTFQNPTGRTLGKAQRVRLMEIVRRTGVPVLEDEFERELRFTGQPLPSLRSLDERGLTVTTHTFSKGLFPGVRLGWVQSTAEILGRMAALKRYADLETSPLLQAALAEFIAAGALEQYLQKLQDALRERHAAAQQALAEFLPPGSSWSRPEGGFALWVETPVDGDRLAVLAATRGVVVTPGRVFDPLQRASSGVRLSLSCTSPQQVRDGIRILGTCASELHARNHPAKRALFM